MNALTLLKNDHDDMKKLLEKADDTTERAVKTRAALLHEIGVKLTAHEKIEEDIFYPALKSHPKAKDIVLEGYQEHHVADVLVRELHGLARNSEQWGPKFKVLQESIEHHIQDEEGKMFRTARGIFSREELQQLGGLMARMKADAMRQGK